MYKSIKKARIHIGLFMFLGLIILNSCTLEKKLVYFQSEEKKDEQVERVYTPKFKPNDLLSIIVTADDMEAAALFNPINTPMAVQPSNAGYLTGAPARSGYLMDSEGKIKMPVIGELDLLGLTRQEAVEKIEKELQQYLVNPIVQIRILNFKITVLGDVKKPGTYTIPNERITLLEALGLAGDLNITGNRKNVKVIRNDGFVEKQYTVDLTSQDFFNSEVYYLDQNDVIYIEPNAAARAQSTVWAKTGAFFVSISSLIVSTIAVVTK